MTPTSRRFQWNEQTGHITDEYGEPVAHVISDSAADPGDGDGPILAASRDLLAIVEDILESGGYDDDGDFYLYHRPGPKPQDDFLDPEPIAKARELIAKIRSA
jgi:hypothetical protein